MKIATRDDLNNLRKIRKFLAKHEQTDETSIDWENTELQATVMRLIHNIENIDNYFKKLPDDEKTYYDCECTCGWFGSSQWLLGGGAIGDTGDHSDVVCPVCEKPID